MHLATPSDYPLLQQLATVLASSPLPVAIVDLETTGGHFEQDRITEIAVLRFVNGQISMHQWLINPQQPISPFIVDLTGINNEMVQEAPTFEEVAAELLPLLRGHLLVAHNSRFDYTFLRHAFARANIAFAAPTLDTVVFSRKLYPEFFKHNLDSIIERFHIAIDATKRHRASADVLALSQFLALSLAAKTTQLWLPLWHSLVKPSYLPATLEPQLAQQIYALPDSAGISIWTHPHHHKPQLYVHAQAFSDISTRLQQPTIAQNWTAAEANMTFMAAISQLHAYFLLGQYLLQHREAALAQEPKDNANGWYTIQFVPNHSGWLQPRIQSVTPGIITQRPYGLFRHRQAAKRALAEWARLHHFCPALLGITPRSLKKTEPCPLAVSHVCGGDCATEDISHFNQRILQQAALLPVYDWGNRHELILTEHHQFSQQRIELVMQSGFFKLDDQHWYFHPALPKLLKQRLKKPAQLHVLL